MSLPVFTLVGDTELRAHLERATPRVIDLLTQRMNQVHVKLHRHIVQDKLSGQVLRNRTGNLRRSTIIEYATLEGNVLMGGVAVGRTGWYGKLHEYGGIYSAVSRRGKNYAIHFPQRSFMRTGFADMRDTIRQELRSAVSEGLR